MKKFLLTLAWVACLGMISIPAWAQYPQISITQGEKASFHLINGVTVESFSISADNRFLGLAYPSEGGVSFGCIYDIQKDSMWLSHAAALIKDGNWYVGDGMIFKDGKIIPIESRWTTGGYWDGVGIWGSSAGLDTIITMSNELVEDPSGEKPDGLIVNYAYLVDGKTGKIIHRVKPHWPLSTVSNWGYGERVNGACNDGTILVGHSSWTGSGTSRSPVFWDLKNDTSFFVGTEMVSNGSLNCTNNDGSIILGEVGGQSVIIHYDRENLTFTKESMPRAPGKDYSVTVGISETGLIVSQQQSSSADPSSCESYIYNMYDKSLVSIDEYMENLYGLVSPVPYFAVQSIDDDSRMITGFSMLSSGFYPYYIQLDENQIFAKARNFQAVQYRGLMTLEMQWRAPMKGQYTLKGYNIFCDSVQINAELIDKDQTSFLQMDNVQAGVHNYAIQAVYEEGVSAYSEPLKMLIIDENGCLPVQEISHTVTYNRFANIFWGTPSAQMASKTRTSHWDGTLRTPFRGNEAEGRTVPAAKSYRNENLDLIGYRAFEGYAWSSTVIIGSRLYVANYASNKIAIYNMDDMSLIENVEVEGVRMISNMAYINDKIYLATSQEEIMVLDLKTMTISNRLKTKEGVPVWHFAYVPSLNDNKGGFVYGDWTNLLYCDMYGREISVANPIDIKDLSISGTAYYDGLLYLFSQTGKNMAEIYTVDFATGQYLNKVDLGENPRLIDIEPYYGFVGGGLSVNVLQDSTIALAATLQFEASTGHVAFLEVQSSPNLLGYNLYRNGTKVNPDGEYIQGLHYTETLFEPGTYTYTVEAVDRDHCSNMLDDVSTQVIITPIGECTPPSRLKAIESGKSVSLTWDYEGSDGPGLVGFDIYRNGEILSEMLLDLKYTDYNLAKGDYVYRVEAYHDNSCTASDSVKITVTYEGKMMPPANLKLNAAKDEAAYTVKASWDLPYFEDPLAIGYCGPEYNGVALADGSPIYAVIGWDSVGLNAYRDLYAVGIEYFIGEKIKDLQGIVYLNDTLTYTCPSPGRITEGAWNTLMFDRYISMDQPDEVAIGYKVTYNDASLPVAVFDFGPAVTGFGDLISSDGQQWGTLKTNGVDANWCINVLVVQKRDLEKAMQTSLQTGEKPVVKVMSLRKAGLNEPQAVTPGKASSASVKLHGFNIYRDDQKLNDAILTDLTYTDNAVPKGAYDYKVTAVYGQDETEVESETILIDLETLGTSEKEVFPLRIFPNPAHFRFHVRGEFSALDIVNLSGTTVKHFSGESHEIDASGLASGMYMLRFTLPDGSTLIQKIILK